MKWRTFVGVVSLIAVSAPMVPAQEARPVLFGAYYRCNEAMEPRADEIYKTVLAPVLEKQKQAGLLSSHGWARHWAGGEWRRLGYMVGTDLDSVVDARNAYFEEVSSAHAKELAEFNGICSSHDDYIWQSVASSQAPDAVGAERAPVGMTTYFECDSREAEADAIFEAVYAPALNKHVEEKQISSWNWIRHMVGGKYRRALVFDGADHKSVLKYVASLNRGVNEAHPELRSRFAQICSSHTDYIWDLADN